MIDSINTFNTNNSFRKSSMAKNNQSFSGIGSFALNTAVQAMQRCEQNPMLNVAVADLSTAIIPRTIMESQTNVFAGFEAFRRESSGLVINCMIPGVIVAGIAKAIEKPIMGTKSCMSNNWANSDTIELVSDYWKKAGSDVVKDNGKVLFKEGNEAKAYNTIKNILNDISGVDGKEVKKFKDMNLDDYAKSLAETVFKPMDKNNAKEISNIYKNIVNKTHIAENIKISGKEGFFSQDLGAIVKNSPSMLKELAEGSVNDAKFADKFVKKASKLVTAKSLMGLGVILPLAVVAQPINRWITEKTSGQKGAPIYKNFGKGNSENVEHDRAGLGRQKIVSVASMVGLAMLSIMKKPSMAMLKNITQFKGIFPSMDQARIISTTTFCSRMLASDDKNDLREATVRDIATFSSLYFLGDYIAKGIATAIQKVKGVQLLNDLKPLAEGETGLLKKLGHWTKNTALKSSEELVGKAKDYRSLCQLGNLGFTLLALGIVIPKFNMIQTTKKCEENIKK